LPKKYNRLSVLKLINWLSVNIPILDKVFDKSVEDLRQEIKVKHNHREIWQNGSHSAGVREEWKIQLKELEL